MLIQKELIEKFIYDPNTGIFTNRVTRSWNALQGEIAGSESVHGYNTIRFKGKLHRCGRLAYLYMTGEWPPEGYIIDHINGVKIDDSWDNLRLATISQNQCNKVGENYGKSPKGVYRNGSGWQAQIKINGRKIYLGTYKSREEAAEAYRKAADEHHGEFACYD